MTNINHHIGRLDDVLKTVGELERRLATVSARISLTAIPAPKSTLDNIPEKLGDDLVSRMNYGIAGIMDKLTLAAATLTAIETGLGVDSGGAVVGRSFTSPIARSNISTTRD